MARRFNSRRVKIHRACQIIELADLLGVHKKTIGRWIAAGLRTADKRRPFLAHDAAFRSFMKARVGQAKAPVGGASSAALRMFRFRRSYGAAVGVLAALNIPHLVAPTKWKHHFGLDSDKEKSRALSACGCGLIAPTYSAATTITARPRRRYSRATAPTASFARASDDSRSSPDGPRPQGRSRRRHEFQFPAPGPFRPRDRELSASGSTRRARRFIVHSFAGDDWRDCRDHVRARLGLRARMPAPAPGMPPRPPEPRREDDVSTRRATSPRRPLRRRDAPRPRHPRQTLSPRETAASTPTHRRRSPDEMMPSDGTLASISTNLAIPCIASASAASSA